MIKILFVCHGNICRSPMAQYVLQDMVGKRSLSDLFEIDSAATSYEEIGNGGPSRDQKQAAFPGDSRGKPQGQEDGEGRL